MKRNLLIIFILLQLSVFAQKTDIVVIRNGDNITGEVKSLKDNMLSFKTDDMGTIKIKWDRVLHIVSKNTFRIELKDGAILLGSLDSTAFDGFVRVLSGTIWTEVKSEDLVGIVKVNQTILGRIDGEISLGYSFTKSSGVHQLNGKFNISYLANRNLSELRSSTILTNQQDSIFTNKSDLILSQTRLFNKNWFSSLSWTIQQNTELGIQKRNLATITYGKNIIKQNRMLLLISTGLAGNNEQYLPNTDGTTTPDALDLEAVFKLEFKSFSNNEPEFNIHPYFIVYPSLTDWGRVRTDFNIDLKFELLHDLFFTLTFYNQFDNKDEKGSSSDYGIITSFGYTF